MAFEYAVVKHQVNTVMPVIKRKAALPVLKTKTPAKFQQKLLQVVDNAFLQITFSVSGFIFQPQKLK